MALNPKARSLLSKYREAESLPPSTRRRALEGLMRAASAGAPARMDIDPKRFQGPSPAGPLVTKVAGSLATKLVIVALAVGVPAAWWWNERTSPNSATAAHTRGPTMESPAGDAESAAGEARMPKALPVPADSGSVAPPLVRFSEFPPAKGPASAPPRVAPSPPRSALSDGAPSRNPSTLSPALSTASQASAPSMAPSTPAPEAERHAGAATSEAIDDEVQLLTSANRALASGDPARAVTLVAEHRARFPRSALAAERDATSAVALCQSNRASEGRTAARTFLEANPASPFGARVRGACGIP